MTKFALNSAVASLLIVGAFPLCAQQPVTGSSTANGAANTGNRVPTLPAIVRSNLPSAMTALRDGAMSIDVSGIAFTSNVPNGLTTYAASKTGLVPAASPTDIAVLPGVAGGVSVMVTLVTMSCTQTTAGIFDVQLIKRSTADSGGTSAAMTAVPLDSGNAAAGSAPLTYTANPTTGTLVGNIDAQKIGAMATATAAPNDIYMWKPSMGQSVVLRGTAQQLAVNLNGATLTGGSCSINFQWIETTGL